MISVGLLGGKGYMGSALLPALHAANKAGKLKLVLLLRASSTGYPDDVEHRTVDLDGGDVSQLRKAVAGLHFVVSVLAQSHCRSLTFSSSAISGRSLHLQKTLIDALAGSKDLISFFPSEWATPQKEAYRQSPFLQSTLRKAEIIEHARKQGVPVTVVPAASTPEIIFGFG